MNAQLDLFVNAEDKEKARELLKAYPSMKAAVEIYTVEKYFPEQNDFTEIDIANIEGNGTWYERGYSRPWCSTRCCR
ncbi:hypothetical protein [Brevibacillus sp. AF8]|uniref:hypothetical protein n=1 Tax=Brevibacillus sp. AF8 TaxID=2825881 RepID=UPI001E48139D|nr:hypothetical protein [Brevibacillus sp. AF8]